MDQKVQYKTVKEKYKKGDIILLQGTGQSDICLLNEGAIEVKRCGENIKGYTEKEIITKSKRIGVIAGPSIIGMENLLTTADHHKSFIAMSECQVTKFVIPSNNLLNFFRTTPQIAMNVLLTMKDFAIKSIMNLKKFVQFKGEIEKLIDNFNLLYHHMEEVSDNDLIKAFKSNGGVFPPKIEGNFLTENFSTLLGKVYGDPGYDPNAKFQGKKIEFYHHLLKTRPDSFIKIISSQISVFTYIYNDLAQIINEISFETEKFASSIDDQLNYFFYDTYSPFNRIVEDIEKILNHPACGSSITKAIIAICRKIDHMNKQLCGIEHTEMFPKLDLLTKVKAAQGPVKENREEKYRPMLRNSQNIIVDYAKLTDDEKEQIHSNIADIRKIDFQDPTGKDSRTIIRRLQADFFILFRKIALRCIDDINKAPLPVQLFLSFGFIDENLLTEEQLEFLVNSLSFFIKKQELEYPIITAFQYLQLIYTDEESPGLSAGGEEFNKILRKNVRNAEAEDTPEGKLIFELDNILKESMRITSDNPRAYIPYLIETSFKGPLNNVLNTPRKLEAFIKNINYVDYTLFFRELTWKIPGKSELIKKEVKPYMILVPNSGIRVQLWQELVGNSRSSRGRFIVPAIFNGDLNKSLITTFGHFRWELNKMIAGSNWMDPVEGGFVGAYYDYTQYYQKMNDLSLEAKDVIKQLFYKIKIDRDRFAHDYEIWLSYEKDGIAKMNKVVRAIFFRYIPFPIDIREKLQFLPLFEHLNTKFLNIRRRDFRSLEARYHKYVDESGNLPEDLQAYLDMMKN
ncbi:MAG: cyclic nucleotide-binding domain-containing protein [Spirochaetes bacterium]|nr:cyclic nucleotide-binding domain-containing protein [Spirochaetota bacterium]